MMEKMRILIVDDDRRMVKTLLDILKVKGYEAEKPWTRWIRADSIAS